MGTRSALPPGPPLDPADTMPKPWRSLERAVRNLPREPQDAALHEVRIRTKRVRYAADVFVPAVGGGARRFAARAADLQGALGAHQDAVVAADRLLTMVPNEANAAVAAGWLAANQALRSEATRRTWRGPWERLSRPKVRFW
jgi:CHAD domain-containing protein